MRKRGAPFLLLPLALAAVLLFVSPARALAQPQDPFDLTGTVVDPTGAAVSDAEVTVDGMATTTDSRGRFSLRVAEPEVALRVRAPGFAPFSGRARADTPSRVTLHPAGVAESVTVTAGRSPERLADTAAAVTVVTAASMLTSGASTADDALRTVPGFSLFRRSSSRVANPTTQGVSLRGLAASGASRALVLADGIPLNDPYGGWVYWDRIPQAAIDRVEVVRGGASESLYGPSGIGGTLQILTIEPRTATGRVSLEGGDHGMARASAYVGARRGNWNGLAAGERYTLDGFPIVARDERGEVDVNAGLRSSSALLSGGWSRGASALVLRANSLNEDRGNGTRLQRNDTNLRSLALDGRVPARGGLFSFRAFAGDTNYDQSFSSVSADRSTERLTVRQRVASEHQGGALQWFGQWGRRTLLLGGEALRVSGGGTAVDSGSQRDTAAYSQFGFEPATRLRIVAGARAGVWSTGPAASHDVEGRKGYVVPRVSLTWAQTPTVSLVGSWSMPQRTPTLNELYRDFQVGSVVTEHNTRLLPEQAQAAEAGVLVQHGQGSVRFVGYWTRLADAITNVTFAAAGSTIQRQRRNAGTIRARGVEAEGEWRPANWASFVASATLTDSRFVQSQEPGLAGKRVSQVPRWQGTISARFTRQRLVATVDWRSTGAQFDDDQNRFELRPARVLDFFLGARLPRGIQPFVAGENVFNAEVDVGRTPVRTVGTPRSLRAGVRLFVP